MWIPLYGMTLFFSALRSISPELPNAYSIIAIIATAILTILIPASIIIFLRYKGYIDSIYIDNPKQRTAPYIYTLICYGFWAYFLHAIMHLPIFLTLVVAGAILALFAVTIINHWWKISAHLTAMGGLLGGVCSFALYYAILPILLIINILGIALLLMYARIYLNAHTPLQVVCGFLLGLLTTFIPTLILVYA